MIIAPDFVFVHLSKTGGTFAAQTLRELLCPPTYGRKIHRLKTRYGVRLPFYNYCYDEHEQHGFCNDIPRWARDRQIVSCIRNPFALYVSEFTFKWWQQYPDQWFHDFETLREAYPGWLESDFPAFLSLSNREASWVQRTLVRFPKAARLGWYSHKFVYYYCKDHDYVFEAVDDVDEFLSRVKETMHPVHFIHTEQLNRELFEFLKSKGYPDSQIAHIVSKERMNTSRKTNKWRDWYSEDLRGEIERRDSLLFSLFPEFNF